MTAQKEGTRREEGSEKETEESLPLGLFARLLPAGYLPLPPRKTLVPRSSDRTNRKKKIPHDNVVHHARHDCPAVTPRVAKQ